MKHNIVSLTLIIGTVFSAGAQTFADAKREFENENYFRAKEYLLRIYAQDKSSEQVPYYLGNAYLKLDETDSANYFYQAIAEGNSPLSLIAKAKLALNGNDPAMAKALVEKAISKNNNKDPEIFYQAGWAYFEPKPVDLKLAIQYFEAAVKANYNNSLYQMALGDAYIQDGQDGNAMNKYESAAEVNPSFALAHLKIARVYSQGKIYDLSIKSYQKAIELNPTLAVAYRELGQQYLYLKDYDNAIINYKKYTELTPDDKNNKVALISFLYQIKEYQKAEDEALPLMKQQDSTNYQLLRMLAYSQYELKQYAPAAVTINKFWKYGEGKKITANDYAYAARIATANNDTLTAFQCFRKALDIDTANGTLQGEYARALFSNQHYAQAAKAYKKRYMMNGANDLDLYYLGRSYYGSGDFVNADSSFAMLTRNQPKSADGFLWRAKSNLRLETGKTLQGYALPWYEKYVSMAQADPKNNANFIEAYSYFSLYYIGQKQGEKAKENINKILAIDPNNKEAKEMLKALK